MPKALPSWRSCATAARWSAAVMRGYVDQGGVWNDNADQQLGL
jgi:hypothetical protein